MFSLVVLFTVFLGLVGVFVFLQELKKWNNRATVQGPQLLRTKVDAWLESHGLHSPTASEVIPLLNQRLLSWIQTAEEKEYNHLSVVELLPNTELPKLKITKVTSHTDTALELECDIEWPMCVPGVGVKVVPHGSPAPLICHLQVEWMYVHAKVRLECDSEDGGLLLSYSHTAPPMMGMSCAVENQSLDDQESAKLASSVADGLQGIFSELRLERVPLTPLSVPMTSLPVGMVNVPVVLVSAPEEGSGISPDNHMTVGDVSGQEAVESSDSENENRKDVVCEKSGDGVGGDVSVGGGVSVGSVVSDSSVATQEGDTQPAVADDNHIFSYHTKQPPLVSYHTKQPPLVSYRTEQPAQSEQPNPTPPEGQSEDEAPPLSPHWRRSSSYEQLTNSLVATPTQDHVTVSMTTPQRKALTMSMAGSEAESLYGADDRIPSTLVFEVKNSAGVRNIVALSSAHANKLRRHFSNAKKLHIYNDHTFLAVHIQEKMLCYVCKGKISGIFGKQAYRCRDCALTLHKQCHFKTDQLCPNTKVRTLNLIYPTNVSTIVN
ncbi:uncharacterized protein LOC135343550 isoform X2 [Halichondria panicea]|uniref:uncharacterized protein LOC135343550 isoform X2 n=1 Tax=Halichondria panicea TaxID=6063 RepID=UPI00312BB6EF